MIKSIKVVFIFFFSSVVIEGARTTIDYFFRKCILEQLKRIKKKHKETKGLFLKKT